jgi:hypothetical protein
VDGKITGIKTHDYHNLLHHILPIAVRGTLTPDVWNIVYRLRKFFRWVCAKDIDVTKIKYMEEESAEFMCKMEQHYHLVFLIYSHIKLYMW